MPSVACAGSDSGSRMRQKILNRDAPSSHAASSSSFGSGAEILRHQEHAERCGKSRKDQSAIGVMQIQRAEHLVASDDHRLFGDRQTEQQHDENHCAPRKSKAREPVTRQRRQRQTPSVTASDTMVLLSSQPNTAEWPRMSL
jgi:hypothetical protein